MNNREIINQLKSARNLEAFGRPRETWLLSQKEILMSQIAPAEKVETENAAAGFSYYWLLLNDTLRYRVLKPVMALGAVLILGSGLSVAATVADASLPGEAFYSVKTATEKIQLAMTVSASKKTEMQMNFVSRRVSEMQSMLVQSDSHQTKAKNLTTVVKKISSDVKTISDNLNRISVASASTKEVMELAKDIDTKTLTVGQELVKAKATLPLTVKSELSREIDLAIISADQAGAAALSVIIKGYSEGSVNDVTTEEVASRVSDRIRIAEENIQVIQDQAAVDAANATTTRTMRLDGVMEPVSASSTQAQQIIEEAKGLLSQKDFGLAVEKIQESKNLITEVLNNTENQAGAVWGATETNTTTGTSTAAESGGAGNTAASSTSVN